MWVLLLIQVYQGAAELHHVELYLTLEECTADMWEIAPRLEKPRGHAVYGGEHMSRWHYQIMRHTADSGEDYLAIHEFYTMHNKSEGWTQKAVPIEADSLDEMREALTAILQDLDRYGVRDAKTGEVLDKGIT
jgi:hypothetical protein